MMVGIVSGLHSEQNIPSHLEWSFSIIGKCECCIQGHSTMISGPGGKTSFDYYQTLDSSYDIDLKRQKKEKKKYGSSSNLTKSLLGRVGGL